MNNFREAFAEYCGEARYAKFVQTLRGSCRSEGRLLYWQEDLLRRFEADRGVPAPKELESVLALYRSPGLFLAPFRVEDSAAREFRLPTKVRRLFRWTNQYASGGSHWTVFALALDSPAGVGGLSVTDLAAPHLRENVVEELLRAIANGMTRFAERRQAENVAVASLHISLLEFDDHVTDLKPWKYEFATFFVLEDLYGELQLGRHLELKLVGIPV